MATLTSDPALTERRLADLDACMADRVVGPDAFLCSDYRSCEASHAGGFYEGQLHHVGRRYDLLRDGQPLRVVVIGQEYGHGPPRVLRQERTEMVVELTGMKKRFKAEATDPARNPHMRGTTSLLRLLFSKEPGTDHAGEFLDLAGERIHIFDAFALTNFLLCSAVDRPRLADSAFADQRVFGAQRGKSTRTMSKNCPRHFRRSMRILAPTVMIAQSKGVRQWLNDGLDHARPAAVDEGLPLEQVRIGAATALLATFGYLSAPNRNN